MPSLCEKRSIIFFWVFGLNVAAREGCCQGSCVITHDLRQLSFRVAIWLIIHVCSSGELDDVLILITSQLAKHNCINAFFNEKKTIYGFLFLLSLLPVKHFLLANHSHIHRVRRGRREEKRAAGENHLL